MNNTLKAINTTRRTRVCGVFLLVLLSVAWAQPVREFRGTFRYFADAAIFESCGGLSWPVAMQAEYLVLERRYLQADVAGQAVFVHIRGQLVLRANMEGRTEEFMEVVEVLEVDANRSSCTSQAINPVLYEGAWQLSSLPGFTLTAVSRVPYVLFRREDNAWQVRGYAGCNRVRAPYVTQGRQLLFGDMAMTKMACFGAQGRLEGAFLRVLTDTNAFDVSGQTLTLLEGEDVLARFTFRREAPASP